MDKITTSSSGYVSYKGFPLLRKGDLIYFGNTSDKFYIMLQIMEKSVVDGVETATKVKIFKRLSDESLPADKQIDKTAIKESLFAALDVSASWLLRM